MAKKNGWDIVGDAVPIVGPIISGLLGGNSDEEQRQQQKNLTEDQVEYAKQLAEHQQGLSIDQWNKTNIGAQKKHYEDAGMNPALMYGGSGGTGTTAGISTPMPTGGHAADAAARKANDLNMGMQIAQMGLIKAQTDNVQADTAKKEEEAPNISADTTNKTIQGEILKVQNELAGKSLHNQLSILNSEANRMMNVASISMYDAEVSGETQFDRIDIIKQELTNLGIEAIAKTQGIALDKAKINEITNGISQKWKELNIQEDKTGYEHQDRIKAIEEYTSNALKVAGIHAAGQVVGDLVEIGTRGIPKQILHKQK